MWSPRCWTSTTGGTPSMSPSFWKQTGGRESWPAKPSIGEQQLERAQRTGPERPGRRPGADSLSDSDTADRPHPPVMAPHEQRSPPVRLGRLGIAALVPAALPGLTKPAAVGPA